MTGLPLLLPKAQKAVQMLTSMPHACLAVHCQQRRIQRWPTRNERKPLATSCSSRAMEPRRSEGKMDDHPRNMVQTSSSM